MKNTGLTILLSILFLLLTLPVLAVDVNLGAATWYSWWEMESEKGTSKMDPAFLYGPIISLGFSDQWNLSMVFLYGQFEMDEENNEVTEINRLDSDISMNYLVNKYFKVFGGIKAMGYYYDNGRHQSLGPALGIGLTIPLVGNLYLLGNVSGMYNYGEHIDDNDNELKKRTIMTERGLNTTLALAYYVDAISTTISLGGRYQFFSDKYESQQNNDADHNFYGLTLSAVYSF